VSNPPRQADPPDPGDSHPEDVEPPATVPSAPRPDPLRQTRASSAWVGVIIVAVVLLLVVIFMLQNRQSVKVSYVGLSGKMPLAVAMLISVAAGLLIAGVAGTLRIGQIRHRVRRDKRKES
jgi:lipopolysaccharide assembly protein A